MRILILTLLIAITCVALTSAAKPSTRQFRPPGNQVQHNRYGKIRTALSNRFAPARRHHQVVRNQAVVPSFRQSGSRKFKKSKSLPIQLPKFWQSRVSKGAYKLVPGRLSFPENRRKVAEPFLPPFVYKRAEDIAGYQKFTLDEAIVPERASARSDDNLKESDEDSESTSTPAPETSTAAAVESSSSASR